MKTPKFIRQPFLVQDISTSYISQYSEISIYCGPSLSPMLEVLSAVTGESIAVFEDEEFADASVKALKQRLAQKIGFPRFRLRLLQDNCQVNDDETLALEVVQLVVLEFLPCDAQQDWEIMLACWANGDKLLEKLLNQPRNPNFEDDRHGIMPLHAAATNGSLECVRLLLEAGAQKDEGRRDTGATPLYLASQNGHLEVVRILVESGANKDQGLTRTGATPLHTAAQSGHIEIVRLLVESGANKDQGTTDIGTTPLYMAVAMSHMEVARVLVESGANQDKGRTDNGHTPLVAATQLGRLDVVRYLAEANFSKTNSLRTGGKTSQHDRHGEDPLEGC